ncbi:MAG: dockerin type I domain-containing protein [Planctomycetia bacterium]|jgi:hypothetical protein
MKQLTVMMALLAVAALVAPAGAAPLLRDGLISVWSCDETTGSIAYDGVGSNNATFTPGMATTSSGFSSTDAMTGAGMGGYIQFNGDWDTGTTSGTQTAAEIGVQPSLQVTDQFTISAWVRFDKLSADYNENFMGIFDSQADDYVLFFEKSGRVRTKAKDENGTSFRWGSNSAQFDPLVTDSVNNNTWVHVVTTYDSTGTYNDLTVGRMYVNGAEVATALVSNTVMDTIQTGQHLSIGGTLRNNVTPEYYYGAFNGGIDEVAVWGRTLQADEVSYLYNGGAGVPIMSANPESTGVFVDPFNGVDLASATPIVHYEFEDNLLNSGSQGFLSNGVADGPGTFMSYETNTLPGLGKNLKLSNGNIASGGDRVEIAQNLSGLSSGTISFWLREDLRYNYNSVFNSSETPNTWEMWIYGGDGTRADLVKARLHDDANVFVNPDPTVPNGNPAGLGALDTWNLYTLRWVQEENEIECNYQLFLNGVLVDTQNYLWESSGDTFYLGGGDGNDYGTWGMDDFRLYDVCLSEDAIMELFEEVYPPDDLPGDANHDGVVDASDATILAGNWQATGASWEQGDFNGDGTVDASDATILAGNWQAGASNTAVPEPSTIILILSALAGLGLFLRRR